MTRTKGGMGIGLSLARAMVEAHGGRIFATSPGLNQGSTFTITLPLAD
jgi:signal transduction histidine kinase